MFVVKNGVNPLSTLLLKLLKCKLKGTGSIASSRYQYIEHADDLMLITNAIQN